MSISSKYACYGSKIAEAISDSIQSQSLHEYPYYSESTEDSYAYERKARKHVRKKKALAGYVTDLSGELVCL